jgi:hypothetical protein
MHLVQDEIGVFVPPVGIRGKIAEFRGDRTGGTAEPKREGS